MRQVIVQGLALIKQFESLRLESYRCPAGKWTIGYGHTGSLEAIGMRRQVGPGMSITKEQAEILFAVDVAEKSRQVEPLLTAPANDYQFAAIVSLAFNLVWATFKSCSVLRLHNAGNPAGAAAAFQLLNKARNAQGQLVELRGLTRRRAAEAALYLTPTEAEEAADPQRTRAVDVAPAEQPAASSIATIGGGIVGAATVANQVVTQLEPVWGWFHKVGLNPHLVAALLGAVVLGVAAWGVVAWLRARREGRA